MTFLRVWNSPGGGGPQLVSSGGSTGWTEKTPAEDTPGRECPHDVDELRPHKGTMWMSNNLVPLKNVESPYGGGVSSLPGAAGVPSPVMFPVATCTTCRWVPGKLQSCCVDETPAGDSSQREYPGATQNRLRPIDIYELPDCPAHTVVEGGPVGPEVIEPIELLVLDHADPAGQHAVIRKTTSLSKHPRVRPELSLGDGLVEKDIGRGAGGTSGSGHYPGQSTLGGEYLPGASGSGGVPGQWTHGGDVVSGTIGAVDSSFIVDCTAS